MYSIYVLCEHLLMNIVAIFKLHCQGVLLKSKTSSLIIHSNYFRKLMRIYKLQYPLY
jgi:hypothetical protein